jgi:alpha,alpha-trehalase
MEQAEIHELKPLFEDVQMQNVFADGKTFVDCIPKKDLQQIERDYNQQKEKPGFSLEAFVLKNFELPHKPDSGYTSNKNNTVEEHIETLWAVLTRNPDTKKGSLIPLPYSYIVPGGRFGEIYYWDSYFTMLGLQVAKRIDLIENMLNNFAHLIDTVGYIPNGNRSYFLGRSQPPFFSVMVRLLRDEKGDEILKKFLAHLEKEYNFWMKGVDQLNSKNIAVNRVATMPGGEVLNRYWDENDTPRPESFREDMELSHQSGQEPGILFRHIRAAAESGWDFSSRWFKQENLFSSIHTTDIIPVDLNCLLYHLEITIAEGHRLSGLKKQAEQYNNSAQKRKAAILKYCWHQTKNCFVDFDFRENRQKDVITLATAFPLFFKIATDEQAKAIAELLKSKFLMPGGLATTFTQTGQQWDAPNGWAPLHWIAISGLEQYGFKELAGEITRRWVELNEKVFRQTGRMMEKYDVMNMDKPAGGGEYPSQDGFGWTNGVFLALKKKFF